MAYSRRQTFKLAASAAALGSGVACTNQTGAEPQGDVIETEIGPLHFDLGMPTQDTVRRLDRKSVV